MQTGQKAVSHPDTPWSTTTTATTRGGVKGMLKKIQARQRNE